MCDVSLIYWLILCCCYLDCAGQFVKSKIEVQHTTMLRRWAGACACFLVSGLMHEVICW